MKIIFNGQLLEQAQSACDGLGWLTGSGIFETIKTVEGKPWALSRHMRRVINSAKSSSIRLPSEEIIRESLEILLSDSPHRLGVLRLSFDINGDWCAAHLPYQELTQPCTLIISSTVIDPSQSLIKRYPYTHRLQILREAQLMGADDAIVLNHDGKMCESAVTNLLFKVNGEWITPPIADGVMPGVMRALVIEYLGVKVRSISIDELGNVQSAFLLSSLRIAQPVSAIDASELEQSPEFLKEIQALALRTSVG